MKHLMVDLETYATDFNASIVSIGACFFDPNTGQVGDTFYTNIDVVGQDYMFSRTINNETIQWWDRQSDEARAALLNPAPVPFEFALAKFAAWISEHNSDPYVWGNGILFDNAILRTAFAACGIKVPWHFRNDRDVRTLVAIAGAFGENKKDNSPRVGIQHSALDDCLYQVSYVSAIWQKFIKMADSAWKYDDMSTS